MKKVHVLMIGLLAFWTFQACNTSTKRDSVESAEEVNEDKKSVDDDVSDFMVKAASGGMMEVQLGEMAGRNASSQAVKDFGAMMVRDHSKANEELKTLAAAKNITLPAALGKEEQEHVSKMSAQKGSEFDKHYIDMMVDDHKEDIDHFEKAAKSKDADLSAFASKTLPVLNAAEIAGKNPRL